MKAFTFSDLNRRAGEVLDAALAEPVSLVKRGKAKLVVMPIAQYEQLTAQARAEAGATAFTLKTAPQDDIDALLTGFQDIIDEADQGETP